MMKISLAFVMVFSMAGFATAGLQLTVNGEATHETTIQIGGELTIGVINDSPDIPGIYLILPKGPGEWIRPNIQPGGIIPGSVINSWGWAYFEIEDFGSGWMWPGTPTTDYLPIGLAGEFGYRCTGLGDTIMAFFSEMTGEVFNPLSIHQVPEPVTMALLGLGTVLIRRKHSA